MIEVKFMNDVSLERVGIFKDHFLRCGVNNEDRVMVLAETQSRRELVKTVEQAIEKIGSKLSTTTVSTPLNYGPVPIRSTGASLAIDGNEALIADLASTTFVVDCTVEGLLHAPERDRILKDGTRILMISNEHPEVFDRIGHDPTLTKRVKDGVERLSSASKMRVFSEAGTDLTVDLKGAQVAGSDGIAGEPGGISHWPGGLVLCFPDSGSVNGTVVMKPGDVNLTFKEYLRSTISIKIESDYITEIDGDGLDAELFSSYLEAWNEEDAYAISHLGWGMNHLCRWDSLPMYDKSDFNGTELRAFAGNFLWSTGANEVAGRFCRGHFDLPMRSCSVFLDDNPVVESGKLIKELT
tara:strand:+ start:5357 stop:6415 length:1059 start_codon:yes stop_codon:yes gene_type:complete